MSYSSMSFSQNISLIFHAWVLLFLAFWLSWIETAEMQTGHVGRERRECNKGRQPEASWGCCGSVMVCFLPARPPGRPRIRFIQISWHHALSYTTLKDTHLWNTTAAAACPGPGPKGSSLSQRLRSRFKAGLQDRLIPEWKAFLCICWQGESEQVELQKSSQEKTTASQCEACPSETDTDSASLTSEVARLVACLSFISFSCSDQSTSKHPATFGRLVLPVIFYVLCEHGRGGDC